MIHDASLTHTTAGRARGYLLAFIGTGIWSTTGPMIAFLLASSSLAPLVLASWRDLLAALILGLVLAWRAPYRLGLARRHWPFILAYGLALAALNAAWTMSVARNGAAVSTVLVYTSPAFVALASRWLFGEPLNRVVGLAMLLSLVGVTLVAGLYDAALLGRDPFGLLVGIGSGGLFAVYSVFGKASARRGLHATTVMLYTFAVAGVLLWLVQGVAQGTTGLPAIPPATWLGLLVLAGGPTLGGYGLYTASLAYLPGATASLITTLEPALTALLAWGLLGETLTPVQLLGGALIVSGVMALSLGNKTA